MTPEARRKLRSRLEKMDSVPTLSAILRPLLHYIDQPIEDLEMRKIVELVSCDESLTAQCIHLANSPLFGRIRDVDTVRGAVMALGVRRLRDLLLSCCLVRMLPRDKWVHDPVAFWEHSFGCALVSRHFAQKMRYPDPEKAYLAGLLHDLGELVNSMLLPKEFRAATERAVAEKIPLYDAEMAVLGFTHCDTGQMLAEYWKLPEELSDAIFYHHDVQQAKRHVALVALVSLSDMLCSMHGLGYGLCEPPQIEFLDCPAWSILTREYPYIAQIDLEHFALEMDEFVNEVPKLVAAVFRN